MVVATHSPVGNRRSGVGTAEASAGGSIDLLSGLLFLAVMTSSLVFFEPAIYDVFMGLITAIVLLHGVSLPRQSLVPFALWFLFLSAHFLSMAYNSDKETSFFALGIRLYLVMSWFAVMAIAYTRPRESMQLIWIGYSIAAVFAVAWGIAEYFGFIADSRWLGFQRAKGPFKDPNVFGPFLVPVMAWLIHQVMCGKRVIFNSAFFIFLSFGLLLSFSRGAWINALLAFSIVVGFMLARRQQARVLRFRLLITSLILSAVAIGVAYSARTIEIGARFTERATLVRSYDVGEGGRFATQARAMELISESPLGIGLGRTQKELGRVPHNVYLYVTIEAGWIAGAVFVLMVFGTLFMGFRLLRYPLEDEFAAVVLVASTAGIAVQSLFIDSTHWRHFYLLMGMLWGLTLWTKTNLESPIRRTSQTGKLDV